MFTQLLSEHPGCFLILLLLGGYYAVKKILPLLIEYRNVTIGIISLSITGYLLNRFIFSFCSECKELHLIKNRNKICSSCSLKKKQKAEQAHKERILVTKRLEHKKRQRKSRLSLIFSQLMEVEKGFHGYNIYRIDNVLSISPYEFEELVAKILNNYGFRQTKVTTRSKDGGVDVIARSGATQIYVECKRYRDTAVTSEQVRKLLGAMTENDIQKGILVTTSRFTKDAREMNTNIKLLTWNQFLETYLKVDYSSRENYYYTNCVNWECDNLVEHKIESHSPTCSKCGTSQGLFHFNKRQYLGSEKNYSKRICPKCYNGTKKRSYKDGRKTKYFIGCSDYPSCHYRRFTKE